MLLMLLLLLLLELLLELLGNTGHWGRGSGHALLRSLAEAGELRLHLSQTLWRLQARVAGVLLLERRLGEARRLRGKRTRLLLLLRQTSTSAKRTAILGNAGALAVAAEEGVRIRIHVAGVVEFGRGRVRCWKRGMAQARPKTTDPVARLRYFAV